MSFWSTAKSAIAGAAGSLLGDIGSGVASAKQAQKQMDFQERMSNTAYQRAADDLEAAGLNRVLALGSPASTPAGAMGQVPSFGSAMSEGANAGTSLASNAKGIEKQDQEMLKIIQETKNLSEVEKRLAAEGELFDALKPWIEEGVKGINTLVKNLGDPEFIASVGSAITEASKKELAAWAKILAEYHGNAVMETTDMIERIHNMYNKNKYGVMGRIYLDSGGPNQ